MRLLLVHQNYPGQFGKLAESLVRRGDQVVVLHYRKDLVPYPGVQAVLCELPAAPASGAHPWLGYVDAQVRRGEATARYAQDLKREGFVPDLIIGHPGWGETLFLKDIWPESVMLLYPEYFHQVGSVSLEARFNPEFHVATEDESHRLRLKNTINLHAFWAAERLWCPTEWQRSSFPPALQSHTVVIHDGIDTEAATPNPAAFFTITRQEAKHEFRAGDEIVTFVNRNHEPVRGFHVFMRALPTILARRPNARVIIIGGDALSYGSAPPGGGTWRELMLKELGDRLDRSRVFFVGKVSKEVFLAVMQVSALHVYLTYPFILSWSFLEAMSCGCRILASRTGPVTEFIEDGVNGTLFDFFEPDELALKAIEILHHRGRFESLRRAARQTIVQRCDLRNVCLPAQLRLIDELAVAK